MHRILQVTFGIALVLLLGVPTAVLATAVSPSPVAAVAESEIAWQPCATDPLPTQECVEFAVPLDYDEPDGAMITLAVARVSATDQDQRIGSLFLNPGGPGVSGLMSLPVQYGALPEAVRERFDVVAFDPRGIGESAPVRCFTSSAEQVAAVAEMPRVPVGPAEETALQRATAEMAQGCAERNAETLAHLSTANVARDVDRLRQAVGDEALTYIGTSYGTYLGATYAQLFPDTIRAMVLDGVVNPPSYTSFDRGDGDIVGPDTTSFLRILSPEGSADAVQAFFAECAAAGPDRCAFAAPSAAETRGKFDTLMDRLRTEPMIVQGPAGTLTVTYSLVVDLLWQTLYHADAWPIMAGALQRLEDGDAVGFLVATGAIGRPPSPAYLNEPEGRPGNNCLDTDNPDDPALYPEMARRAEERSPYFGALWTYLALPCAFWPAEDADRYTGPWDAETSAPILLISRVYDPATPHSGAVAAAETLANARLLTIDGWGHGFFLAGRSTCADDYMAAYLIDLELPPVDTICPEDVPPFSEPAQDEAGSAPPAATPRPLAAPSSLPVSVIPAVAQSATPAAASPVAASGDFAELVDIGGGRRLYLECRGQGSPTVILEAGLLSRSDIWSRDAQEPEGQRMMVLPGVAAFTRVCAYDRPGTIGAVNPDLDPDGPLFYPSRSDPVPQPRTAQEMAGDLHALLRAADVPGPYVLVAHSAGGLVVRLYASTYPDEVVGMVLVDATPEDVWLRFKEALTPAQWTEFEALTVTNQELREAYPEAERLWTAPLADDPSTGQVRQAQLNAPLRPMPLVVLSHGIPFAAPFPGWPSDTMEEIMLALQEDLAQLTPNARHVIAAESGHDIHQDQPELVIAAIREVVAAVRVPGAWPSPVASPAP